MLDRKGLLSSVRPAITGSTNHGPNLFSYIMEDTIALSVLGLMSRSSFILYMLSLNLSSCDTDCTSVARPARPRNVLSVTRNTFWKSMATVCACIPSRVSLRMRRNVVER
jgi:hypothetical protein